jgi:hypothetical protein
MLIKPACFGPLMVETFLIIKHSKNNIPETCINRPGTVKITELNQGPINMNGLNI